MSSQSPDPTSPRESDDQQQPATTTQAQPSQPAAPTRSQGAGALNRLRHWRDVVEEILGDAQARGDFDNLRGKGQPLRLEDDTAAGDKALAYRVLKNNNIAPPEIERGREIDGELERADELLETLRRRRNALLGGKTSPSAADRRMYNLVRDKTEAQYRELLRATNSKVLSLNILAPAALHRPTIKVDARMQAFAEEFPRLEE